MAFFLNEMGRIRPSMGFVFSAALNDEIEREDIRKFIAIAHVMANTRQAVENMAHAYHNAVDLISEAYGIDKIAALDKFEEMTQPGMIVRIEDQIERFSRVVSEIGKSVSEDSLWELSREDADAVMYALTGRHIRGSTGLAGGKLGITPIHLGLLVVGAIVVLVPTGMVIEANTKLASILLGFEAEAAAALGRISCDLNTILACNSALRVLISQSTDKDLQRKAAPWLDNIDEAARHGLEQVAKAGGSLPWDKRLELMFSRAVCAVGVIGAIAGTVAAGFIAYKAGKFIYRNL